MEEMVPPKSFANEWQGSKKSTRPVYFVSDFDRVERRPKVPADFSAAGMLRVAGKSIRNKPTQRQDVKS